MQGRAHVRQVQRAGSEVSRWQQGTGDGPAPATPSTINSSSETGKQTPNGMGSCHFPGCSGNVAAAAVLLFSLCQDTSQN